MPSSHTTIPTPAPRERSLLVIVEESVFAANPDILPPQGTRYEDCDKALFAHEYNKKFNDYLYTGQQGDHGILFAKNKTTAEANTPFRTTTWTGNHRWPPVLLFVAIIADSGAPRSFTRISGTNVGTGIGPTFYDRVGYIPDVAEGTRFLKEEFFGPRTFDIPQMPVPVPTSVSYNLPGGVNGNFPECLHPDIIIPPAISASSQVIAGSASGIGTAIEGQRFPATNFTDWSPYVLSDRQEQQDGGWYRVRIRVFPPPQPEIVVQ